MMIMLYLAFAPLFFLAFSKRMNRLVTAIKRKDGHQLKVEALFMGLTIAASLLVLLGLQRLSV